MSEVTIENIGATRSLLALNALLTQAMTERAIQPLIGDANLRVIVSKVVDLAAEQDDSQLVAAAVLGRLAAVVHGDRANVIRACLDDALTEEPADIDTLQDGDMKAHAAAALNHVDASWCEPYLVRQTVRIDAADNARRELMTGTLRRSGSLDKWLSGIAREAPQLRGLKHNARLRRVSRILEVMNDVARAWHGKVGREPGEPLALLLRDLFRDVVATKHEHVLFEAMDHCLGILLRAIELRFSFALQTQTYEALNSGAQMLGVGRWHRFLRGSEVTIPRLRETLLEAVLVLARQGRTDAGFAKVVVRAYTSVRQAAAAVDRHLRPVGDLDPQVRSWWSSLGRDAIEGRPVEQKIGRTEDEQIGELLIELDIGRPLMRRLANEIVPILEISDPVSAATSRKASDRHVQVDQIGRRLARMRRLKTTDIGGEVIEYSPSEHELTDGHRPGVRDVRVVREGVLKEFGGRVKTVVKPWVEEES